MKLYVPVLVALGLGLAAGTQTSLAQQAAKIGVFDAQKITAETAEGAKIQARLNSLKDKKSAEIKKLQDEFDAMQQEFVKSATSMSDEKKRESQLKLQRKQDEIESAQKAAQRELQIEVEQAQEGWQRRVLEVIANYGKQNGFTLIVPSDVAVYYNPSVDITAEVVKTIDSTAAAAPAPAAPAPKPAAPAPAPKKGK